MTDRSCSCFEFQKLSIPCSHAIAAALKANVKVEGLVGDVYTIEYLKAAYAEHVLPPVELNTSNQLADDIAAISLHPPVTRRPPGRPRKKRFFSRGEVKVYTPYMLKKKIKKKEKHLENLTNTNAIACR